MDRTIITDSSKSFMMKKRSKLAARFNYINMLFVILILIITIIVGFTMINNIADAAAIEYARTYTIESVDIIGSFLNTEISLVRHASQSPVLIDWFTDEENPEKKAAAFQKMMLYADLLHINGLHFGISNSLNDYSISSDAEFQDFVPFRELDPSNNLDSWFFSTAGSVFDFTMDLSTRLGTDSHRLWINHKVISNDEVVGVFSSALDFYEIFQDLFGLYEGQNVRGLVIDYRGIIQIDSAMPMSGFLASGGSESHILSVNTDSNFVSIINNDYLRNPSIFYGRRTDPEVIRLSGSEFSYLSIAPIPSTNWLAITFYDTSALIDISTFIPPIIAVVLAFLVYVILSYFLIQRLVFTPLSKLTQSVATTGYDEDDIYGVSRDDEIGELARTTKESWQSLRDMTLDLKAAAEEAEAANVSKSAFLAKMSHEIRTPMNVILGITEILMQNEKFDTNTNNELAAIYNSCDMLLSIINDILDLSKIEAGKLEVIPAKYELASLIHDAAVLNIMRTGSKPIEFKLNVDENLPATLIGDELRIKQILSNLLSNAFKYTDSGNIDLSFFIEDGEDDDEVILVFTVSDTGHGLAQEEISKMFDEYSRFNLEVNRTIEGTGLGMNIIRNLLRLMNGTITVNSELNKGSDFTIRLPQGKTDDVVLGRELAKTLREFRLDGVRNINKANIAYEPMPYGKVMIVDDVESNLFVARGLMLPYGMTIDTVTSGLLAIEKIKSGNVYDIIFMDHMMPKMDGIETTEAIREYGYTHPIVALTANAVIGQADIFLSNGFDDFISKPIDIRRLNTLLKKYVRDKQSPEVIEAALLNYVEAGAVQNNDPNRSAVSTQLAEYFIIDALKALSVLETMIGKPDKFNDEDLRSYTISVHAMKTALSNIAEPVLSAFAHKLERAGGNKEIDLITAETPMFISELHKVVNKLKQPEEKEDDIQMTEADRDYLREKLLDIKNACEAFNTKTAKETLIEVRQKSLPQQIAKLLSLMAEQLLSGDSDGLLNSIENINEIINSSQ